MSPVFAGIAFLLLFLLFCVAPSFLLKRQENSE